MALLCLASSAALLVAAAAAPAGKPGRLPVAAVAPAKAHIFAVKRVDRARRAAHTPVVAVSVRRRPNQIWVEVAGRSPLPRHHMRATGRAGDVSLKVPGSLRRPETVVVNAGGIRRVVASSRAGVVTVTVERDTLAGYRSAYRPGRRELVLEVDMGGTGEVAAKTEARPGAPVEREADTDPVMPLPPPSAAQVAPAPARSAVPLQATSAPLLAAQPKPHAAVRVPPAQARTTPPAADPVLRAAAAVKERQGPRPRGGSGAVPRVMAALPGTWRVLGAQEASQKLVTLDFVNADIQDVLKALAIQSGANILVAPKVEGKVTVGLRSVTPEQALEYVVRLSGLAYGQEDGTYVVCPREQIGELFPPGTRGRILFPPPTADRGVQGGTPTPPAERKMATVPLEKLAAKDVMPVVQKLVDGLDVQIADDRILVLLGTDGQIAAAQAAIRALEAAAPEAGDRGTPVAPLAPLRPEDVEIETYTLRYVGAFEAGNIIKGFMDSGVLPKVVVTAAPAPAYPVMKGSAAGGPVVLKQQPTSDLAQALRLLSGGGKPGAEGGEAAEPGAPGGAGYGSTVSIAQGTTTNTLLLIGSKPDIALVRKCLQQVDIAPRQVMIDLKVTDVSLTDEQRLGVSWSWTDFTLVETAPTGGAGGAAGDVVPEVQLGRFGHLPVGFNAVLEAMLKTDKARLLANPRIAVLDGNQARIHVGDTVRYLAERTSTINGTSVTIGSTDVGVLVEVMPRIGGEDVITLDVRPKVNVITGYTQTGDGGQVPNTSERSVETVVRLRDGETLAIGGLIRDEDATAMQKIPGLGDLPLVGQLFKFRSRHKRSSEVLIFITPTLVPEPS